MGNNYQIHELITWSLQWTHQLLSYVLLEQLLLAHFDGMQWVANCAVS